MELPLITLLDRLQYKKTGLDTDCAIIISGIRLLTESTAILRRGILYVGDYPRKGVFYEEGTAAVFSCNPVKTPYSDIFVKYSGGSLELFNEILEIYELFRSYDDQIITIIYEQRGLKELMLLCSKIVGNPAYLVDSSFKVLAIDDTPMLSEISAIWKNLVSNGYLSYDIVSDLKRSDELQLMESYKQAVIFNSKYFNNTFINFNLRYEDRIWGHFFIVGYLKKITMGDVAYANYLGRMVLSAMKQDMKYATSRGSDYENFFIHLLSGTLQDKELIKRQLQPLDWNINDRYLVFKLIPKEDDELLMETMCSRLENIKSGKPLLYEGSIVAAFPLEENDSIKRLEEQLRGLVSVDGGRGGISDVFDGFHRMHTHYQQACVALELGLQELGTLSTYRECAVRYLLQAAEKTLNLDMACEKVIFRLRDYDEKHNANYLTTLETYLKYERSIASTADALFIHRNTLVYRIEKLTKMFNIDLDDSATRIWLTISFQILRYQESKKANSIPKQPGSVFFTSRSKMYSPSIF